VVTNEKTKELSDIKIEDLQGTPEAYGCWKKSWQRGGVGTPCSAQENEVDKKKWKKKKDDKPKSSHKGGGQEDTKQW
jgi:hypothetical protein